jgi:hypothetical protein
LSIDTLTILIHCFMMSVINDMQNLEIKNSSGSRVV